MDRKRIHEIAERAHYSRLSLNDPIGSIEEGILVALREALGEPTPAMVKAGTYTGTHFLPSTVIEGIWTAMAAVRLRDVLSVAKE